MYCARIVEMATNQFMQKDVIKDGTLSIGFSRNINYR